MNELVLAKIEETEECGKLLEEGRQFQLANGFVQWTAKYPTSGDVEKDIKEGTGYVYKIDGKIAAYMCIRKGIEPYYVKIDGEWDSKEPYVVVHRMGLSDEFRGKGLTKEIFLAIEELSRKLGALSIRIDTHTPNKTMQHVLERCGFTYRGIVNYPQGTRLGYDKNI